MRKLALLAVGSLYLALPAAAVDVIYEMRVRASEASVIDEARRLHPGWTLSLVRTRFGVPQQELRPALVRDALAMVQFRLGFDGELGDPAYGPAPYYSLGVDLQLEDDYEHLCFIWSPRLRSFVFCFKGSRADLHRCFPA